MTTFSSIASRVLAGKRLSEADALALFDSGRLAEVGELAALVNERRNGRRVFFNVNRHINYTNICLNRCRFCAFRRDPGGPGAYLLSPGEICAAAAEAVSQGATEIHMVGGLHPDLPFEVYLEMLVALKSAFPALHLKAFTAVEIDHLSRISGLTIRETLLRLRAAGLDSLPGGGAEIFAEPVRGKLCADKISGKRWLEVMAEAHSCGLRSNATMLYGHLETLEDRVAHMALLRELQDRTGGFQAFVPLRFQPGNSAIGAITAKKGGADDLMTVAVARLFLDNFPHIKAYWVLMGVGIAQVALNFGADDLDGTVEDERIGHEAGADSPRGMSRAEIVRLIRKAGREPVERDSLYREVQRA